MFKFSPYYIFLCKTLFGRKEVTPEASVVSTLHFNGLRRRCVSDATQDETKIP